MRSRELGSVARPTPLVRHRRAVGVDEQLDARAGAGQRLRRRRRGLVDALATRRGLERLARLAQRALALAGELLLAHEPGHAHDREDEQRDRGARARRAGRAAGAGCACVACASGASSDARAEQREPARA